MPKKKKLKTFRVTVSALRSAVHEVEAETEDVAETLALDGCGEIREEQTFDMEVTDIEEVKDDDEN